MTTTDFDASKLEPGTPELEHGRNSEAKMILAFSQAVSLKRIADAMTANTEQHDRVEASQAAVEHAKRIGKILAARPGSIALRATVRRELQPLFAAVMRNDKPVKRKGTHE